MEQIIVKDMTVYHDLLITASVFLDIAIKHVCL